MRSSIYTTHVNFFANLRDSAIAIIRFENPLTSVGALPVYAFNIINSSNQFVNSIGRFLFNVTEPVLAPIRRVLPNLGGIDISPIVVLVIIFFLRTFLWTTLYPLVA